MTIRTIVAAAALVAFTTPAFAQEVVVAQPSTLQGILGGGGFAAGTTLVMIGTIVVAIVTVENGKTTINTDV